MKLYFCAGVYFVKTGEKDVEMNNQKLWERKVEDDMDRALANREFQVYLQPKISTTDEVLGGAEALVRWIHPTEGFIPPNRFIPIFEKNGFILKLDDFAVEQVEFLTEQECDLIQGYFYSKPMPVAEFAEKYGRKEY